MASVAQIIVEVDDHVATQAFKNINAEAAKLGPTLQPVQRISEQVFNNVETGALKARESAALLGEEFGVHVPRALRGVLAEAKGIGPALNAAFSGLAIIGFIDIAERAGEVVSEFVAKLMGWGEAVKKQMDAQVELNKLFIDANAEAARLQEAYRLIGLSGLPLVSEKQKIANEHFDAAKEKVSALTAELAKLQKQAQETQTVTVMHAAGAGMFAEQIEQATKAAVTAQGKVGEVQKSLEEAQASVLALAQATKNAGKDFDTTFSKDRAEEIKKIAAATEEASAKLQEMTDTAKRGGLTGIDQVNADALAQMEAVEKILSKEPSLAAEASTAVAAIESEASRKRIAIYEKLWDEISKINQDGLNEEAIAQQEQAEKLRRMEDETINAERAAAIASAPPWERANATIIADYQERMDKIKEMVATGDLDELHATRMQTAALQDLYAQRVNELASQMQSLFDDITSGNIGKTFLKLFEQMIFRMVATWIVGMNQMRAASQQSMGSGGGILGAIFGGLFGGGSSGGGSQSGIGGLPGVITNFMGGAGGDSAAQISAENNFLDTGDTSGLGALGISAGMGTGTPGGILPSGSGRSGVAGALGGLGSQLSGFMDKIFPHGAGPISGSALAALGISLLASNFRGGGILHGLGGAAGGALTGFAIAGPIGAMIGGILGFFSGLLGHSTKKARLAIEANIKAQAQAIEDGYNLFQIDWSSSRSQLEALRQQGVDALKQAGVKDIDRSRVGHVDHWIDKAEKEIDATQAERNARSALTFGPAQFRVGGFVGSGGGGAVPSWFAASAMHFAGGGAVPAFLHPGEYVMRPEAVSAIGRGNLERMNAGGGAGGDTHLHFEINAIDAKSFDSYLANGGMKSIAKAWHRARMEGGF